MVFAATTCPTANIHRYPLGRARCASKVKRHNNNTVTCVVRTTVGDAHCVELTCCVRHTMCRLARSVRLLSGRELFAPVSCLHPRHPPLFTTFIRDCSCQNKPRARRPTPQRPTPVRRPFGASKPAATFSPAPIVFVKIHVSRSNTLCTLLQYVL